MSAEDQARIDSIRACSKCKDKLVVFFMIFGRETPEQVMAPKPLDFVFGQQTPKPEPEIITPEWLKDIITIGED